MEEANSENIKNYALENVYYPMFGDNSWIYSSTSKEEYNDVPVYYCTECLSLAIMNISTSEEACYCDKCGCTSVAEAHINDWEKLYKDKYGVTYLNNTY